MNIFKLSLIFGPLSLASCGLQAEGCANKIYKVINNGDRSLSATIFNRECGVTVADNVQVTVEKIQANSTTAGNVLILDGAEAKDVKLKWVGTDKILIEFPKTSRVFKQKEKIGSVNVIYKYSDQ